MTRKAKAKPEAGDKGAPKPEQAAPGQAKNKQAKQSNDGQSEELSTKLQSVNIGGQAAPSAAKPSAWGQAKKKPESSGETQTVVSGQAIAEQAAPEAQKAAVAPSGGGQPATSGQTKKKQPKQSQSQSTQPDLAGDKGGQVISMFPARPKRQTGARAPGDPVQLITNLFMVSLKQQKPIYRYGTNIEAVEGPKEGESKSNVAPEDRLPRKLPKEIKTKAINAAVGGWVKQRKPKEAQGLEFSYLFDSNGSVLYTLFNMLPNDNERSFESDVRLELDKIVGKQLAKVTEIFRVKLTQGLRLDLGVAFRFCQGKERGGITEIQEEIRALNVILRGQISTIPTNLMTPLNVFPFKRENQFGASPGVIMNRGYSLSFRPTEMGVVLNVANTVGAFYEEYNLIQLLKARYRVNDFRNPLRKDLIEKLEKELRNKQVEARHINYGSAQRPHYRKYRVQSIGESGKSKFNLVDRATNESREVTIEQYFLSEYKIKLEYPAMPCVIDKGRKIPIEVCHLIEKQRVLRKMDPDETAEIIKKCALPPDRHFEQVTKNVKDVSNNKKSLLDFGLDFDAKPIEVTGRELKPISLVGSSKRDILPSGGQYDARRDNFYKPVEVKRWKLAFIMGREIADERQRGRIGEEQFSQWYSIAGRKKGVAVGPMVQANFIEFPSEAELRETLKRYFAHLNEQKYDHAILVLPRACPDWVYRYIQYLEVTDVGHKRPKTENWTRTSCIKYENFNRKIVNDNRQGEMFISNLWLKYNTKLGGINFVLKDNGQYAFLKDGWIFVSVDVCHPAPGDKLSQSVAAVVGMWDLTNQNMSCCTRLKVQKKARENHSTIEDVGEIGVMLEEVLDAYKAKKKKYPSNVVILRDGVSEGQFKIVLHGELVRVVKSLEKKYGNQRPKMTCLVVQKRHKVRFIRKVPVQTPKGPNFNIQPGTVVDSQITHPTDFDFYLAPHKALQGTAKAPHIYMIYDDNKFSQDDAQAMIHALSYLSPRCTKSTSIPTPVNLADLAAEQGKNIVISWNDEHREKMSEEQRLVKLNSFLRDMGDTNYKNTLYYV